MVLKFYGLIILSTWVVLLLYNFMSAQLDYIIHQELDLKKQKESHPCFVRVHSFNNNYGTVTMNKVLSLVPWQTKQNKTKQKLRGILKDYS